MTRIKSKAGRSAKEKLFGFSGLCLVGICSIIWTRRNTPTALKRSPRASSFEVFTHSIEGGFTSVDVLVHTPDKKPKGIIFLAHGCSHSHTDFWPSTPVVCPQCLGLPEERAIVKIAREEFDLVVVAMSSLNRMSKCWSPNDETRVAQVLSDIAQQYSQKLPIFAFGASSGGSFVGRNLFSRIREKGLTLNGYIAQIAAPNPLPFTDDPTDILAAVYITMNRDESTEQKARSTLEDLERQRIPCTHITLDPLPVSNDFFHERIPEYSLEQSTKMVQALKDGGYIDPQYSWLKDDPRRSDWRKVIRSFVSNSLDSLEPDESPISEVMNVAYGMHEMTRDGVREGLQFVVQEYLKMRG